MSLRNAWLPRPSAKNEYRQLSCSSSPGSVSPSARKAALAVPPSSGGRRQHAGAGDQAHDGGGSGAHGDGASPCGKICAAEPDHQRIGGKAT